MTDRAMIISEYERREKEAGGVAFADMRAIATCIAEEMRLPFAEVRNMLVEHWVARPN